jgi:AcrR family transcriptional regulator
VKKRQDARDRILAAAISEFSHHGFERAISYIASKAYVNDITIYRHFKHKSGLQLAALLHAQDNSPMITYMEGVLARERVPPLSTVVPELGRVACGPGRELCSMIYFVGLQNHKLLVEWGSSTPRHRLVPLLAQYVVRLQAQGQIRGLDPGSLARSILGSMLSLFSRNCLFASMEVADQEANETASLLEMLERRTRHS